MPAPPEQLRSKSQFNFRRVYQSTKIYAESVAIARLGAKIPGRIYKARFFRRNANGKGKREWGMGSGGGKAIPSSQLPTPHSPLPFPLLHFALYLAFVNFTDRTFPFPSKVATNFFPVSSLP